ncbi:MAG TPA: NAD(P)-dependent oxidoreductase [Streptosporangiaceae bacterium]
MRVFVAGATGAIGVPLVSQLIDAGHQVTGTYRSPEKAGRLRGAGATAVALDLLDPAGVRAAVLDAAPDAIIHQATALAAGGFTRKLDRGFAMTNRLRTEGTDALIAAARDAGVRRLVAQSFAPYRYARVGSMVKTEDDPLDPSPAAGTEQTNAAMAYLDQAVTDFGGIALRYGGFYGADNDGLVPAVRKRQFPVVASGAGLMSFIHVVDAAAATVLALGHDGPAVYNIVDDDPAPLRDWLPALAAALGAKPPRHAPAWLARLLAGEGGVIMATESRGAANANARRELGWTLRYPSWRQGFPAAYPRPPAARLPASGNPPRSRPSPAAAATCGCCQSSRSDVTSPSWAVELYLEDQPLPAQPPHPVLTPFDIALPAA